MSNEGGSKLVFISHDSRDCEVARAFSELLSSVSVGLLETFWSSDSKGACGLEFGSDWYRELGERLSEASAVVCILTRRSVNRPWLLFEAGWAKGLRTPVLFGLAMGVPIGEISSGPFQMFQNCLGDADSICKLVRQLLGLIPKLRPDDKVIRFQVGRFLRVAKDAMSSDATELQDLTGQWRYEVVTPAGERSHSGHCSIKQTGRSLEFDGVRTHYRERVGRRVLDSKVHRRWYSEWSQICEDGRVRVDYRIVLEDFLARAVCILDVHAGGQNMSGDYHLLPPFQDKTLNATLGHIEFTRVEATTPNDTRRPTTTGSRSAVGGKRPPTRRARLSETSGGEG